MTRVLIVDDDTQIVALIQRWLIAVGYEVLTATDFKEASAEIRRSKPEAVIIDVRLAEFNGLQLAMQAQQERPDVRLVLISGWDDPVLRRDAEQLGATFLQKPLTAFAVVSAVEAETDRK